MADDVVDDRMAADDPLAQRIRSSVDGDAAPVSLDEVRRRVRPPDVAAAPDAAAPGAELDPADRTVDGGGPPGGRGRTHRWLAAAAAIVLVVGFVAFASTRSSGDHADDLDVSGPGTTAASTTAAPPTSILEVSPAAGGLYDPAGTAIGDRYLSGIADDGAGRVYLAYVREPVSEGEHAQGLLVADAADGSVLADRELPGHVGAMAASGSTLWLLIGQEGGFELWRSVEGGDLERVDALPPSDLMATIAADDDGVWVRLNGRLQRRDPESGALVEESTDPAYASVGSIAVDGERGWTVALGGPSERPTAALVPFDGVEPREAVDAGAVGAMATVDGTLIAGVGGGSESALVVNPQEGGGQTVAPSAHLIVGIDGRAGRAWAVSNDLASSTDIGVVTFELGGRPRPVDLGLSGLSPMVAAIDEHHALVCVSQVADPAWTPLAAKPPGGSACRLLDDRTSPDAPPATAPPETVTTAVPTTSAPPSTVATPAGS